MILAQLNNMNDIHYRANITVGGLLIPESRKIAKLLLTHPDEVQWKDAILQKNILQQRSPTSSIKISQLIRARLNMMTPELWEIVAEGDSVVSTHAIFASAIKHCRLLGDFLDLVVREQFKRFEDKLSYRLWDDFIEGCRQRDLQMPEFPPTSAIKVRSNVFKILYEVGYLKDRKTMELKRINIAHDVLEYLTNHNEEYVLNCIQL